MLLFVFHTIQIDSLVRSNPGLAEMTKVAVLLRQPALAMFHAMFLSYQPFQLEVLALYIVLLLAFPATLWFLLRVPTLVLTASGSVYVLARAYGWNLPAYPTAGWPLNPLTWQLLFVIGAWLALRPTQGIERIMVARTTRGLAISYLIAALVVWIGAQVPALGPLLPGWLGDLVQPSGQTALDMVVLAHVVSVAVVALWLSPANWSALRASALRPVLLCGRYPLATLCCGVFLAFASRSLFALSNVRATHIAFALVGVALMSTLALVLAWIQHVTHQSTGA